MASLFDLIDKLIREHGSASILKDHLELVREQAKSMVADLERKHAREIAKLEQKIEELQATERCPFCRKPTAELVDFMPHENLDLAELGQKQALYRCTEKECRREFRKKV